MDSDELLSKIRDAVVVLDSAGNVTAWRGAAERIFGYTADEILGRNLEELLQPTDANGNKTCLGACGPLAKMRMVKAMPEADVLVKDARGEDIWIGFTYSFDRNQGGEIVQTVAVARDISRRKTIDMNKSEVISAVSHELRSPLTSVKGFTKTLLDKWDRFDDETRKHFLLTINTDADRVTRLITELLDVSRIEAGRLQLRRHRIQVGDIARRVADRIQPRADDHQIEVRFPEEFPEVFADQDKVEQVLTNLVENAVKYTPSGKVSVTGEVDISQIQVSVCDEGEGIPADHRLQVFGKFFRRGERAGNPTGTGLGLYISKGLVEAHGGRIWVDEAPGGGAMFAFTLPRSEP